MYLFLLSSYNKSLFFEQVGIIILGDIWFEKLITSTQGLISYIP